MFLITVIKPNNDHFSIHLNQVSYKKNLIRELLYSPIFDHFKSNEEITKVLQIVINKINILKCRGRDSNPRPHGIPGKSQSTA